MRKMSFPTFITVSAVSAFAMATAYGCGSSDDDANTAGTGAASGSGGSGGGSSGTGGTLNIDSGIGGSSAAESGVGGSGGTDPLTGCGSNLTGIVRDFRSDHPDFECSKEVPEPYTDPYGKDCGPWDPAIVGAIGSLIGADRKPAYAGGTDTPSTTGASHFDEWFTDVPGTNLGQDLRLDLLAVGGGNFAYDTDRFFPIDGQLFAADPDNPDKDKHRDDEGTVRNFHFTYELHTTFRYEPGSVFTFRGDDDVFVYIDDKLVVNLGGIHVPLQGRVDLDANRLEVTAPMGSPDLPLDGSLGFTESIEGGVAASLPLDLAQGQEYTLDFFFAERNTSGSNFRLETNLVFTDCGVGVPK